ncbi:MAG: family 2 glycosyl transferase [Leptothrix sp. (in: Bacteria)]|nr:family 2 glycosyl transferase [Leptothrix sp. (in: b-proteobacteria)]
MARYSITLAVIARDEAPRIGRLLASVAPWVDEMLVLDTGSLDGTAARARRHGARVEHFTWCDDFAAARNASLALAAADWHVVLDADEWLIDGGEVLQALRETAPGFVGALHLLDQADAATTSQLWLSRVLPGSVRYAGRVHEQPQHGLAVRRLALRVGHDGYGAERRAAKRGRNRRLLQAELAQRPDDAYLWYQLGKDCAVYDEHDAAAHALQRADALCSDHPAWRHDLATRLLFSLKKTGRHAEGLDFAQTGLDAHAGSPDFFFALGDLLLDWAAEAPSLAGEVLPMAQQAWQRCLEIGEQPGLSGAVAGRGSWLAAHNLAVVLAGLGHAGEAQALRARHPAPA